MRDESGLSLRKGDKVHRSNLSNKVILLYCITIVSFAAFFALGKEVFGPKYYDGTWNSKFDMLTSSEEKVDFDIPYGVSAAFAATILSALLIKIGRSIYHHLDSRKKAPYRQTDATAPDSLSINDDETDRLTNQKCTLRPQSALFTWSSRISKGVLLMPTLFFLNFTNAFVGQLVTTGQFIPQSANNYFENNPSHQQGVYYSGLSVLAVMSLFFLIGYVRDLETDTFIVENAPLSTPPYQTFGEGTQGGERGTSPST